MKSTGKTVVLAATIPHLVIALFLAINHLSSPVIWNGDEDFNARMAYSVSQGDSGYGPTDAIHDRLMYTPLTSHVQSWTIKIFGLDIRYQRAVTLLFGIGAALFLAGCIRRLTGSGLLAFAGAAMFIGIDVDYWYIRPGPNAAHTTFALAGLYLLVRDPKLTTKLYLLAIFALFLSFWCKQTGVAYLVAGAVYVLMVDFKKGLKAAALGAGLVVGSVWYMTLPEGSTFLHRVFIWGTHDSLVWSRLYDSIFFPHMFGRFGISLMLIAAGVASLRFPFKENFVKPHYVMLGASAFTGIVTWLKYGSGNSQAIFLMGVIILCGIVFLHRFHEKGQISTLIVAAILAVQSITLLHGTSKFLITREDTFRFNKIMQYISEPDKNVIFYSCGYHNALAGKQIYANLSRDVKYEKTHGRVKYPQVFVDLWMSDHFDTIITYVPWEDNSLLMRQVLEQHFELVEDIPQATRSTNYGQLRMRILVFKRKS